MTKRTFELSLDGTLFIEPSFEAVPLQPDEVPLELSVQKWEAIVGYLQDGRMVSHDGGWSTCALCRVYYTTCAGCPVAVRTGTIGCGETPYKAWKNWRGTEQGLSIAREELEFLESLREER